jgi:hypothetical protein
MKEILIKINNNKNNKTMVSTLGKFNDYTDISVKILDALDVKSKGILIIPVLTNFLVIYAYLLNIILISVLKKLFVIDAIILGMF